MRPPKPLVRGLPALALVLLVAACASRAPVHTLDGRSMGTGWQARVVVDGRRLPAVRDAITQEFGLVVAQMSTWEPDSDLSRFNRAAPGSWHELPAPLFELLDYAFALSRDTGGAYDLSVGPLAELWGFGASGTRTTPPSAQEIEAARARVGWQRVELDRANRRALQPGGIRIDVSSIGPGHALDRVATRLRALGLQSFLLELGGEMLAAGRKPDGSAWRVAVEPARAGEDGEPDYDLVLALQDQAAGSSGDYRVGFEHAGRRYSHTIDPRSGEPVAHDLVGVTVVAPSAMQADALAAALMVLGPDQGMAWARERGIAAVFTRRIDGGFERSLTPAMERWRSR